MKPSNGGYLKPIDTAEMRCGITIKIKISALSLKKNEPCRKLLSAFPILVRVAI